MLTRLVKGLAKAMGAKATKKSHTKAAPPMSKSKKVPPAKVPAKTASGKATAPKPGNSKAPVPLKPASPKVAGKQPEKKPKDNAKAAPVVAVLAPVTKVAKGKSTSTKSAAQALLLAERMCRESGCENQATTKGYCRLDYIKNWKKIKRKEMILKEGKLNQYIEELVSKYPDKYIEVIRQDLSTEVNFTKVIHDLELDESIDDLDYDGDSIDSLIGAIRKEDDGFDDTDF